MSARDVIASELARISRVDMSEAPRYARASVRTAALHVERALTAAGYRILGPDEVDPVTLERAELACFHQQSKIHERKRTEWDRGNDSAVNGCIHAIRALASGESR